MKILRKLTDTEKAKMYSDYLYFASYARESFIKAAYFLNKELGILTYYNRVSHYLFICNFFNTAIVNKLRIARSDYGVFDIGYFSRTESVDLLCELLPEFWLNYGLATEKPEDWEEVGWFGLHVVKAIRNGLDWRLTNSDVNKKRADLVYKLLTNE